MKLQHLALALIMFFMLPFAEVSGQAKKKANRDTEEWRYELECVGTGSEGTYLVKVWSYSKKPKVAIEQAKKNAVHGIIFKGFPGTGSCTSQKPMVSDPSVEEAKADYFDLLFKDGGKYMKFVSAADENSFANGDVVKIGKEYKIGVVVTVLKENLRKELQDASIIRGLNSGF